MIEQLDMLGVPAEDERLQRRLQDALPKAREPVHRRLPLVDVPRAANADPETSHTAAERIKKTGALRGQQRTVLDAVKTWPGCTSAELAVKIGGGGVEAVKWRWRTARRLPELCGVFVRKGAVRGCAVTDAPCITWWPL